MTELETRLMDALAALSAQWEAEQHQHADEQDMLNVRIDDLTQLVQDFAGQHEQQAAALGLNRFRQHIEQRQQARDGPSR